VVLLLGGGVLHVWQVRIAGGDRATVCAQTNQDLLTCKG
jgi:hypothetical protein